MNTSLVFVYGSLMRGFPLHLWLRGATFVGDATIAAGKFKLVSLGAFPALLAGGGPVIHGEVYEVTPSQMRLLDMVESCPRFYTRELVNVTVRGEVKSAWVYHLPQPPHMAVTEIPSGKWGE